MNFQFDIASNPTRGPTSLGARIGGTVFCLIFFCFGVVFLGLMARDVNQSVQARRWPPVPCVIESSSVVETGNDYQFKVSYRYEFEGKTWHANRVALHSSPSANYADVQRLVAAYPAAETARCFVNPADPSQAILRQPDLWILPFAVIPLLFTVLGAGGVWATWRNAPRAVINRDVTVKGPAKWVFALSAAIGIAGLYFLAGRLILRVESARYWPPTPCTVLSSRVHTESGDDGDTYSIDILYSYTVEGREYRSNRYDFDVGSSSFHDTKAAVVGALPPGSHTVCYVNPRDASDAVLYRGYTADIWFGLIPVVFLLVGVGGLVGKLRAE